jgi:hypothetical protein
VKITVRCGAFDGGKPCGNKVGAFARDDLDFARGVVTFDRLREGERYYDCPDHGKLQIHNEDVLRLALNPSPPVIMARSVLRMGQP